MRPEAFQVFFADEEKAGSLGREEPLVRAGCVEVAAQIVQVEGDLADGVRAVHVG